MSRRKVSFIFLAVFFLAYASLSAASLHKLIVFYSTTCHKCNQVNRGLMPQIEQRFKESLKVEYRDIAEIENYKSLLALKEKYGSKIENTLPVFFMNGSFLSGEGELSGRLEWFIEQGLKKAPLEEEALPQVDLLSRFKSFKPAAVTAAGLIDGINPCAFTVIVFFVSFLALQRYRRREIAAVGLTFIFAVFLTYILIGLGLFGFLYRVKGFWIVSRLLNLGIGLFCFILAVLALYDLFIYLKSGKTEKLTLQLPQSWKERIHNILGRHYRPVKNEEGALVKKGIFGLLASALITGFLVSLIEAVCTGQVYLPTLIFILKTSDFKLQAAIFILLYNLMFILPLFIIFLCALFGVTSTQFSAFMKRNLAAIKIIMAVLFIALGVSLVYSQSQSVPSAAQAIVVDESQEWDFGKVKEGSVVKHTFYFRNNSSGSLKIIEVSTSCGCTLIKVNKKSLLAGEAAAIEVSFNSKGYSGETRQFVYVHTDNLDNPVNRFIIKALVQK